MKTANLKIPPYKIFSVLTLLFLIGVAIGSVIDFTWQNSWLIFLFIFTALLIVGLYNFLIRNRIIVAICWTIIFLIAGLAWYSFFDKRSEVNLPYGQSISIMGTIIKPPEEDPLKQKITVETKNLNQNTRLVVNGPHYPALSYGDKVKIEGKLEKPGTIEDFDYGSYLKRYLVFGVIYQPTKVEKTGQENSFFVQAGRILFSIPHRLEGAINWTAPEPQASLAGGLLFGTKRNIPDDFKDALAKTGLTHIIALSGYNVTIIITALAAVLSAYYGRKKTFLIGVAAVLFFVIMTGAASSVVRAAIFSILILLGRLIGRRGDQTNLMLLAAFLMILFNPYVLRFDIGFQLSFAAFAGLIYLSPIIEKVFERSFIKYLPVYLKSPLIETMAAQVMVFPLIIIYFGRLSLIAPIANLLVLWIIPLAMLVSLADGIFGLTWWPIAKLMSYIAWPVLTYIVVITEWLSKIPLASIELKNLNWILALAGYFLIFLISIIAVKKLKKLSYKT